MEQFPLLSLPEPALQAVVDAVPRQSKYAAGALAGLRGTCRLPRGEANARTRCVSMGSMAASGCCMVG